MTLRALTAYSIGLAALYMALAGLVGPIATADPLGLAHVSQEIKDKYRRPDAIPYPKSNPYHPAKAELGKRLFFDPRLSSTRTVSCATCHNPAFDWSDGLARGIGVTGVPLPRRSPSVLNAAWLTALMWDGRAATLEQQATLPLTAEHEMGMPLDRAAERLREIEGYKALFATAYPGGEIRVETMLGAIATFERTLVSQKAPFDRWIDGDEEAISDSAKRGFAVFNGAARCSKCHASWRFTDDSFHDIGLETDDIGRGQFAPPSVLIMQHAFKTPSLRDLRTSGPYMHNGSLPSLDKVIAHYEKGGKARPSLSPDMKSIKLTEQEREDLMAFLHTVQGAPLETPVPRLP
ncbi:cytochrome c peroxidase [Hyphomicrobium sp.]|uniref:cytochrome c peroxidase n=1 Tax=Hyphomicrobium sp. TaxID=82 RepID=UPI002E322817|nr:cytochrome c peroxidase [Hyphomicrobium sp.]HEX2841580.1 cytochrome c peroxidase [Hyphomicrobium sp.]